MTRSPGMPARLGGARTRAFFAELLGLDAQSVYEVEAVSARDERFIVQLRAAERPQVALYVEAFEEGRRFMVRGRFVTASVQGQDAPTEVVNALRAKAFSRRPDVTMKDLEDVLAGDPETSMGSAALAVGSTPKPKRVLEDDFPDRAPDAWADYLARVDILCQKVISMWLFNPCTLLLHGDRECFGPPNLGISMVMTINAPWDNHVRDIGRPRAAVPRYSEPNPDGLLAHVTDMRERDVIIGAREKELAIFQHVFDKDPGLVVFFHACVAVVSGTDAYSIYKEHKAKHHLPVLYFRGGENQDLLNFYREILVDRRLSAAKTAARSAPRTVNLVGLTGQLTAEVQRAIEALGITVNGVVLPMMDLGAVERFEQASLNVVMPNVDFQNFYDQLLLDSRVPQTIYLEAPHGLEGTRRWLAAIATACGREDRLDAVWQELVGARLARWRELVAEAHQHTLCFVVRPRDVEQLLDCSATYGIPVLTAVAEMGFRVEVLVHAPDEASAAEATRKIHAALAGKAEPTVRTFETPDEMLALLKDSKSEAVFSNFFFDWRITSSGKSIFSLQHFEAGVDGAFRTVERLLQVCRTGLFGKYGRYLARDRVGRPAHAWAAY